MIWELSFTPSLSLSLTKSCRSFVWVALFFSLPHSFIHSIAYSGQNNVDEELFSEEKRENAKRNEEKIKAHHFFVTLSCLTQVNSIFTKTEKEKWNKKRERGKNVAHKNHIIIYEVLRRGISFGSFIIYWLLYSFSTFLPISRHFIHRGLNLRATFGRCFVVFIFVKFFIHFEC